VIVYSRNADADRAFFRDVLGFKSVDAGHGWLIFALPLSEVALHPFDEESVHELYLMCDDLKAEIASLIKRMSNAPRFRKHDGAPSRRFGYQVEMRLAFISRSTPRP
jgi:catechol 2,3-dioxygenase-like lactoylglutathione lyase family enzyme